MTCSFNQKIIHLLPIYIYSRMLLCYVYVVTTLHAQGNVILFHTMNNHQLYCIDKVKAIDS